MPQASLLPKLPTLAVSRYSQSLAYGLFDANFKRRSQSQVYSPDIFWQYNELVIHSGSRLHILFFFRGTGCPHLFSHTTYTPTFKPPNSLMPSYRFLLVLALAASAVTSVLSVEAATQPLKKNEERASGQLELVERGPQPQDPKVSKVSKMGWKMKTLVGVALAANTFYAYVLLKDYQARKAAKAANLTASDNHSNSSTPAGPPAPADPPTPAGAPALATTQNDAIQPYYGFGSSPSTETLSDRSSDLPDLPWVLGPRSSREERPLGRRSPVDISKARSFSDNIRRSSSHLDLLSRADLEEALGLFSRTLDKLD